MPTHRVTSIRFGLAVVLIAIAHTIISCGLLMLSLGMALARFDSGGPASWRELVLEKAVAVLFFPVSLMLDSAPARWFPGLWGYVPTLFNGFIWALVIVSAARWLRARRVRAPG